MTLKDDTIKLTDLRNEQLALVIGTLIGQISELLNQIQKYDVPVERIYKSLLDIQNQAAMQVHELYYKGNKP